MAAIEGLCQEVKEKQPTLVQMVEALKQASDETVGLLIKHFIMRDARQKDGEVKKVKLQMAVAPHSPKWGPHTNEELWQQLHQALLEIGGEGAGGQRADEAAREEGAEATQQGLTAVD